MIPRYSIPVVLTTGVKASDVHERPARITHGSEGFGLWDGGALVATCTSAKRLADWAFENGARSVRHDYDLAIADGEL